MARLNDPSVTTLTTPKIDMLIHLLDQDDGLDKNIEYQNVMKFMVRTGAGIPVAAPDILGQIYVDTTNGWRYIATGISAVSDWHLQYAYGTVTVTAGGGDITVNLGGNWINGKLEIFMTETNSEYIDDTDDKINHFITSYDALTNGGYTTLQIAGLINRNAAPGGNQDNVIPQTKTANVSGLPKSATTTSFTLDDDTANTVYVKWIINA